MVLQTSRLANTTSTQHGSGKAFKQTSFQTFPLDTSYSPTLAGTCLRKSLTRCCQMRRLAVGTGGVLGLFPFAVFLRC